jgi:16S rRNA (cytidine1402-2'-O)-methyltransferase
LHEELWRGHLKGASLHFTKAKALGEFTLIIGGANLEVPSLSDEVLKEELKQIMLQGVSRSQASRQLAQKVAASRRHLYQLALTIVMDKVEVESEIET